MHSNAHGSFSRPVLQAPHDRRDYCWRTVAGDQFEDHCRRVVGVLDPSDTNPFHPALFILRTSVWEGLNKEALNEEQLLLDSMVNGDNIAHTMYGSFLKHISHLGNLYTCPPAMYSQSRSPPSPPPRSPRQRFSPVASDRRPRPPTTPMRDIFSFNMRPLYLQPPLSNFTLLQTESSSTHTSTGSVPS